MSSALLLCLLLTQSLRAHEVFPAIADMTQEGQLLRFEVQANLESFVAGIDLTDLADTDAAPQAADYDSLRALPPDDMEAMFTAFWPQMAARMTIRVDGTDMSPVLVGVEIPATGDVGVPRPSILRFDAALPAGAQAVQIGWDRAFGTLVIRQQGVDAPYDGYLEAGALSDPVRLAGGDQAGLWQTFFNYIPVGFDHIVPKGLDHILFVLGLFFLSTQMRPLLLQVSAFTLAHTLTLALAALGYVSVPGSIVEPLIAASIVFVAVENIFTQGLSRWRPVVVFAFGLLHGLGFASVLGEFGLPQGAFIPALIGFNIGVELGQLAVIATAFALVAYWFGGRDWYRRAIATPASVAIALVGGWWFVERVFL
ncbi:MAG: HupE/UreJ family protein [Rhodobacterales bacterium]|nr:HupE/UreJ family protein [Rhodobacterales bacterium]